MLNISALKCVAIVGVCCLTASCGGESSGAGGGGASSSTPLTGYLIDTHVEGADYYLNGQSAGKTGYQGVFGYHQNDTVTFMVGNAEIGTVEKVADDGLVFLHDIIGVPRDWSEVPELLNLAAFVQSLDDDRNPNNGIRIPTGASSLFPDATKVKDLTYSEIKVMIENAGGRTVSLRQAQEHLESVSRGFGMTVYHMGEDLPPLMPLAKVGLPPFPSN